MTIAFGSKNKEGNISWVTIPNAPQDIECLIEPPYGGRGIAVKTKDGNYYWCPNPWSDNPKWGKFSFEENKD